METNVFADDGQVTVSFIIDTDYILKNFPDAELNCKSPVRIDARVLSLLSDIKSVVSGYNTRNMKIKANTGDVILFTAEPKHFIAKECVQAYKIVSRIGRLDIMPHKREDDDQSDYPGRKRPEAQNFMAMVKRKGLEELEVRFSVHTLSKDGTGYDLHGIFYTDLLGLEVA